MELVLKRNEGVISLFGELDVSQNSPRNEWPYHRRLEAFVTSLPSGTAHRSRPTSLVAVMLCNSPCGGGFNLYSGIDCFPRKTFSINEMPSKHSISYLSVFHQPTAHRMPTEHQRHLLAGISIFNCAGSCLPFTIGLSFVDVYAFLGGYEAKLGVWSIRLRRARFLQRFSTDIIPSV